MFAAPWALGLTLVFGCAGGKSDDVISFGPPGVGRGDDGNDRDDAMASDDEDSDGDAGDDEEPDEPFDDAGDDAPADDGAGDGAPPMGDDGAGTDDGGGDPPPPPNGDDGGQPPPPPPPQGGLDGQCQSYCTGLQQCGFIDGGQAQHASCVTACAEPWSPACDAAWSNVITCVAQLDCIGMGLWWFYIPGYPCAAEDQAAAQACG